MTDAPDRTHRILLSPPPGGAPVPEDFRFDEPPVRTLVRARRGPHDLALARSLYARTDERRAAYAPPVQLGEPMPGEWWARSRRAVLTGSRPAISCAARRMAERVRPAGGQAARLDPARHRSARPPGPRDAGPHGLCGLHAVTKAKPGKTLVVGAASGAVGAIAGQLAKSSAAASSAWPAAPTSAAMSWTSWARACLDPREPDLAGRLETACPDGSTLCRAGRRGLLWAVLPCSTCTPASR